MFCYLTTVFFVCSHVVCRVLCPVGMPKEAAEEPIECKMMSVKQCVGKVQKENTNSTSLQVSKKL